MPDVSTPGANFQNSNAEIIGILMDFEKFPDGNNTANIGHAKNPQKQVFLNAKMVGDTASPGVGKDGVFRDPWGNPYIISIDMNYDNKCRDGYYRSTAFGDRVGLIKTGNNWEASQPVMVWSFGPDGTVETISNPTANKGFNKDNVLSW